MDFQIDDTVEYNDRKGRIVVIDYNYQMLYVEFEDEPYIEYGFTLNGKALDYPHDYLKAAN